MMMKFSSLFVGASLLLASVGATPALADNFRPERGVRCDEFARVCYERGIPSVEMTENYFGHHAAKRLARDLRREERGYGARTFYPERGVRCDRAEQVCYNRHGEPSFDLTRRYLGPGAARTLAWRGAVRVGTIGTIGRTSRLLPRAPPSRLAGRAGAVRFLEAKSWLVVGVVPTKSTTSAGTSRDDRAIRA